MKKNILFCILLLPLAGCFGLFDSGTPWKDENFELIWIDDPQFVTLSFRISNSSLSVLISEVVYSVGSNKNYVIAKQHPDGNKSITNYYIINKENYTTVIGPMTLEVFETKKTSLGLPEFTTTLDSLK